MVRCYGFGNGLRAVHIVVKLMIRVVIFIPLKRGSADDDDVIGREIDHQGTDTSLYVYTIDWCVVGVL